MTPSNLRRRSALHGRGFHRELKRAGPLFGLIPQADTTSTLPTSTEPAAKDKKNTPATSTTTGLIPGILSSILSPTESTTSKLSSSTTPTSSVSATTSSSVSTSFSLPTTKASVPTTTSTTPHVVVQTATRTSSSTSLQTQTPSQSAQVSNGISAVTVIGGIGGALLATILLTVTIGFFLRRWRRRNRSAENPFEASQFRRSGALLDEKDDNTPDYPRPPSMIERRNATSPPAAYPSDEPPLSAMGHGQSFAQYGANQSQYGAIPQHPSYAPGTLFGGGNGGAPAMHYNANPYSMDRGQGDTFSAPYSGPGETPAYGAPPVPGVHGPGAYAPYGVDSRYPQSQRYPHSNQYQNQQPQQHQQRGFGQGLSVETPTSPIRDENVLNFANPFSPLRVPINLGSTENSGPESRSTPTSPSSTPPPSTNPGTSPFVTRQSHDAPPTYMNDGGYANVQRDVKMLPAVLKVANGNSDTALPPKGTTATTTTATDSNGRALEPPRPLTVYGDDDVYGGM